ncbi:hypothetical protein [Jeotgalibacillus sp. R-1-5s-1]|uniref:hypothetical protein n=1 Tax=Jeotgalibacillus sp. R-1-5s-1 TaxID=2555897 RepID=UPI00106B7CFE|nr:hypothetical protein [Jeotgalibacillus sp. R-1-5s-1]TFE03339.1 hypothetical protein E2491_00695 [Jeotgalibacillus sp. R-1-5s-1]
MKLDLTKEQYRELVGAMFLSDLVRHSMKNSPEDHSESFIEAEQALYSQHDLFDETERIEKDEESGVFLPTLTLESEQMTYLRDYEQAILTDQIAAVLARNAWEKEVQSGEVTEEAAVNRLIELEDHFHALLEEKGLSALTIK